MSDATAPPWYTAPSLVSSGSNGIRKVTPSGSQRSTTRPSDAMYGVFTMIPRMASRRLVCSSGGSPIMDPWPSDVAARGCPLRLALLGERGWALAVVGMTPEVGERLGAARQRRCEALLERVPQRLLGDHHRRGR